MGLLSKLTDINGVIVKNIYETIQWWQQTIANLLENKIKETNKKSKTLKCKILVAQLNGLLLWFTNLSIQYHLPLSPALLIMFWVSNEAIYVCD